MTLAAIIALLLALVLGTFSGSFWLAAIGVFPPVGLCTATAVALGKTLTIHRGARTAVLILSASLTAIAVILVLIG